ncbi:4-hydroxy-tetrahydrodipicolinate synthase [Halobacillus litoralis]|uniref:4-hydroxy-tetrahydrodipicolinate synthase n=1 Tax=Halobacillus litoralis TaxID=45668 RepID=UPI001CFDF280|nr:4-hydroxy-tetrahydrodipicolinate synthase [Halobacillus litoralis]
MKFGKVLTAMVTPFDQQGSIDFEKTTDLIEYLLSNGTDGLVVAGTTGESPTLDNNEKVQLWKHVVNVVNNRVPVIAGTGSNNTKQSIELSQKAEAVGVDAVMLVAPYYNKPNQKGLYSHFKTIADSVSLPVMLYNVPGRSVVRISPETIIQLSKVNNIVSVKEATGDLNGMAEIISKTGDDFSLYSGDDHLTLPSYVIGAAGIISVSSHVIGNEMQRMLRLFDLGRGKKAGVLHRKLLPVFEAMFSAPSPGPVKAALKLKGLNTGGVRLPLVPLTESEEDFICQLFNNLTVEE